MKLHVYEAKGGRLAWAAPDRAATLPEADGPWRFKGARKVDRTKPWASLGPSAAEILQGVEAHGHWVFPPGSVIFLRKNRASLRDLPGPGRR